MKAAAYYRRSTNLQKNSIEMQKEMALDASIKNSIVIDAEYLDDAISGKTKIKDRPELDQLLKDIDKGLVNTLFVYKRDRLTRKAIDYLKIYDLFKRKNVNVIFTADNEHSLQYSPQGEIFELVMAAMIEKEGEQIVERLEASRITNFLLGKNPGNLPFGYSHNQITFVRNEDELQIVKKIFDLILDGKSPTEISDYLNEKNLLRKKKKWSPQYIKKIITNSTYMGLRILKISEKEIKGSYDQLAIIDEEEWTKAQDALEKFSTTKSKIEKPKIPFPLQGLLICKHCKSKLKGVIRTQKGSFIPYYSCKNQNHKCEINKYKIEENILDHCYLFFKKLLSEHHEELYLRFNKKFKNDIRVIDTKIEAIENELIKKTEQWYNEKSEIQKLKFEEKMVKTYDSLKEYYDLKDQLVDNLYNHEIIKSNINKDKKEFDIKRTIDKFDPEKLEKLFQDIIHQIIVDKFTIEIVFKHPFLSLSIKEVIPDEVN